MIQIKNYFGKILKEVDFADLSSANLRSADLRSANLRFADLSSANLRFADLRSANLSFADLSFADLRFADLRSANLMGIKFKGLVIKKLQKFDDLYKYVCFCIVDEKDQKYIALGCYCRKIEDWESNFWNNDEEFPNDNSEKSNLRLFAYETCKRYFEVVGW